MIISEKKITPAEASMKLEVDKVVRICDQVHDDSWKGVCDLATEDLVNETNIFLVGVEEFQQSTLR